MNSLVYVEATTDAIHKFRLLLGVFTDPGTFHLNSLEVMLH